MVTSPSTVERPNRVRMHALAIACLAALLSGLLFAPAVSTAATSSAHWSSARADALPAGAVARWSFDDQTDPTGDDVDGHDADVIGASFDTQDVAPTAGNQAALRFDGNDYTEVPDPGGAANLDGFDGLTIAAWVNPSRVDIVDGGQMILSKYHSASPQNTISYWFLLRGDEIEVFVSRTRSSNEARRTSVSLNLTPGQWVHVAGTWDGSQFRLFANGEEVAGTTSVGGSFPTQMDDSSIPVNIGSAEAFAGGERSSFFHGLIDDVRLFRRALSPAEIAALNLQDSVDPTVDLRTPPDGAVYSSDQTVTADYSCADELGGSGLGSCVGTVPQGSPINTTAGEHQFTVTATDLSGNVTVVTHTYTVSDLTGPTINLQSPADGAVYARDEQVLAAYSCSDGSGIDACVGTTTDGTPVDTSSSGNHQFRVDATDIAGNTSSTSHIYTVAAHSPDAMIRRAHQTRYLGNGVHNTTATEQTKTALVQYLGTSRMIVRIENEGSAAERFLVRGTRNSADYRVSYFDGPTDISQPVKAGTYQTPRLDPDRGIPITVEVVAGYGAYVGDEHRVAITAVSTADASRRDTVAAVVGRRGFDPIGEVIDACATSALVAPRCFGDPYSQLSYTYGDTVILLGDAWPLTHGQVIVWRKIPFGTQWQRVGTATIAHDGQIFWTWRTSRADVNGFDGYRFQFRIGLRGYSNVVGLWVLLGE